MIDSVKKILSQGVADIIAKDPLLLLKTYSKLYLCGGQPRVCARSQRLYYLQIQKNGLEMAEKYEKAKSRTCIPAWSGLKFITATQKHWIADLLSDDDAIYLLEKKYISEKSFTKLPDSYKSDVVINDVKIDVVNENQDETTQSELDCIAEFKTLLNSGMSKKEIKAKYSNVDFIGTKKCNSKLISELIEKAKK